MTLAATALSHLGELRILLEPVLPTLVVLLGQMVLDVQGMAKWVAVRWRLGARSLQGSVRGDYSCPFGLVWLLLLQRDSTQTIICESGAEIGKENRDESALHVLVV